MDHIQETGDVNFGYNNNGPSSFINNQHGTNFANIKQENYQSHLRRYGIQGNDGNKNRHYNQGGYDQANNNYQYNYNGGSSFRSGPNNYHDIGSRQVTYDNQKAFGGGLDLGVKFSGLNDNTRYFQGGASGLHQVTDFRNIIGPLLSARKALKALTLIFGLGALTGGFIGRRFGRLDGMIITKLLQLFFDKFRGLASLSMGRSHHFGYSPTSNNYNDGSGRYSYNNNQYNHGYRGGHFYGSQSYRPINSDYRNGNAGFYKHHTMVDNGHRYNSGRTTYRK